MYADANRSTVDALRRMAVLLEYDGTDYSGFQTQINASSIQEHLEISLYKLTGERHRVAGAGRTDAGVHAHGQVAAFDTWSSIDEHSFSTGLNHYLPYDISVRLAVEVSLDFDPRRWAISREYRYSILNRESRSPIYNRFAWHVGPQLDVNAMNTAGKYMVGHMDFGPFAKIDMDRLVDTHRDMFACSVIRNGDFVLLDICANSFLRQQVRRTAGSLIDVGLGRLTIEEFVGITNCGVNGYANRVAPSKGLSLMRVNYLTNPFINQSHLSIEKHPAYSASLV